MLVCSEEESLYSRTKNMNISLWAPFGSPPPSWVAIQLPRLSSRLKFSFHLEIKCLYAQRWRHHPDTDIGISRSWYLKVRPPKGYDHSTIQIRQDLKNSSFYYVQLHFNKISLCHYIWQVEYMKLLYISVFTFRKRNTGDLGICPTIIYKPPI